MAEDYWVAEWVQSSDHYYIYIYIHIMFATSLLATKPSVWLDDQRGSRFLTHWGFGAMVVANSKLFFTIRES
jgi:hypothetical protein